MEIKLGSIPVKVHAWFFVMAAVLGSYERDPARLAAWVLVVLVSVLVHELGHALMGMAFGLAPRIDLHMSGGTTSFASRTPGEPRPPLGAAKNIAISLAGPFTGFLLAGLVFAAGVLGLSPAHPLASHVFGIVLWVNVGWGIFNLLPMLPLDGGNVMNAALTALSKKNGEKIARVVSIVIAGAIALYAFSTKSWWILYLVGSFIALNVQALRRAAAPAVPGA